MKRRDFVKIFGFALGATSVGVIASPKEPEKKTASQWATEKRKKRNPDHATDNGSYNILWGCDKEGTMFTPVDIDYSARLMFYLGPRFNYLCPVEAPYEHLYSSLLIADRDMYEKSFNEIFADYIDPALSQVAQMIIEGRYYPVVKQFDMPKFQDGCLSRVSKGGPFPVRCSMRYNIKHQGIEMFFDLFATKPAPRHYDGVLNGD